MQDPKNALKNVCRSLHQAKCTRARQFNKCVELTDKAKEKNEGRRKVKNKKTGVRKELHHCLRCAIVFFLSPAPKKPWGTYFILDSLLFFLAGSSAMVQQEQRKNCNFLMNGEEKRVWIFLPSLRARLRPLHFPNPFYVVSLKFFYIFFHVPQRKRKETKRKKKDSFKSLLKMHVCSECVCWLWGSCCWTAMQDEHTKRDRTAKVIRHFYAQFS